MTTRHGVLDYAPPPKATGNWVRRAAGAFVTLIVLVIACALPGIFVGRIAFKPFYSSNGFLFVETKSPQTNVLAITQQVQMVRVVATALAAAHHDPAGNSLPSSASDALKHATIALGRRQDIVTVSYTDSDPQAAACMAREIVKAYFSALTTGRIGSGLVVTILEMPTAANPIHNAGQVLGGLVGTGLGIVLFVAWVLIRIIRPKRIA